MEDLFMLWIQRGTWSVLPLGFSALKLCSFIFPFLPEQLCQVWAPCSTGVWGSCCLCRRFLAVPVHSLDLICCWCQEWHPHGSGFLFSSCEIVPISFGNCSSIQGRDSRAHLELCLWGKPCNIF